MNLKKELLAGIAFAAAAATITLTGAHAIVMNTKLGEVHNTTNQTNGYTRVFSK